MGLNGIGGGGWHPPRAESWRIDAEPAGPCKREIELNVSRILEAVDANPNAVIRVGQGPSSNLHDLDTVRVVARLLELRPDIKLDVPDPYYLTMHLPRSREAAGVALRIFKAWGADTSHVRFNGAVLEERASSRVAPPAPAPLSPMGMPQIGDSGLRGWLHPNDPKNKLGRQVGRAANEMQGLVADIDRAIAQTGTAASALRTAIAQQQGLIAKYEQEARAAMASGGKEAARPAGRRLLEAKKDLEGLHTSLAGVEAQVKMLTERRSSVEAKLQALGTDALANVARLDAAKARADAADVVSGVDRAMGPLQDSFDRIDEKARKLVMHAEAVEGLDESGVIDQVRGDGSATPELDRLVQEDELDALLGSLK